MGRLHLGSEEQRLLQVLDDVLAGATRMEELQSQASPLLTRLVSADIGALCSWRAGEGRYDWAGDLPEGWPEFYKELEPHDFVRRAVSRAPNVALVDAQMISARSKRRSVLYERTRALRLEQVMAILLTRGGRPSVPPDEWHGGVTLYRTQATPFSSHEAAILQQIAVPFARAMERCQRTERCPPGSIEAWLLNISGLEALVLDHEGREIARTAGVTALLCRWYPGAPRRGMLPPEVVARITGPCPPGRTRDFQVKTGDRVRLGWVYHRPPALDGAGWVVVLEERPRVPAAPTIWREKLTPRELHVVELVIQGLSNAVIGRELGLRESTVKQHVQRAFDALGVNSRTQLCMSAYQEAFRFPSPSVPASREGP